MIEIVETWTVVDRWWTESPERRTFAVVRIDGAEYVKPVCVVYDFVSEKWSIIEEATEPEPEGPRTRVNPRVEEGRDD